jgi:hypothetical protein
MSALTFLGSVSMLSRASSLVYGPSGYTFATAGERRNRAA